MVVHEQQDAGQMQLPLEVPELGPFYLESQSSKRYPENGGLSDGLCNCCSDWKSCCCYVWCGSFWLAWRIQASVKRMGSMHIDCGIISKSNGWYFALAVTSVGLVFKTLYLLVRLANRVECFPDDEHASPDNEHATDVCSKRKEMQQVLYMFSIIWSFSSTMLIFRAVKRRYGIHHNDCWAQVKAFWCAPCFILQMFRHIDRASGHLPTVGDDLQQPLVAQMQDGPILSFHGASGRVATGTNVQLPVVNPQASAVASQVMAAVDDEDELRAW